MFTNVVLTARTRTSRTSSSNPFTSTVKLSRRVAYSSEKNADQKLGKRKANEKDLAKAKQEVAQVQAQFALYDRTRMPQPGIDLIKPTDETAMTIKITAPIRARTAAMRAGALVRLSMGTG